jgi:hypothetical protein
MIMADELKACPHGKEARTINIGGLAPFSIYLGPDHACHRDFGWFETREEAIAAWNTRPLTGEVTEEMLDVGEAAYDAVPEGFNAHRTALGKVYLAMSNASRGNENG